MKYRLLHLVLIVLLCFGVKRASAQVNTDAVDAYWTLVEQLKQDRDPAPAAWEAFFDLPGNQLALKPYKNLKSRRDSIRSAFQLVYIPGKKEQLQNTRVDVFLENIIYTRNHEAAIKEHVAFVKEGPAAVDSMYELAYRYLPSSKHKRVKGLKVYYIGPLTPDSRALEDAFFINTAMEVRFYPKRTMYIGAHELHHLLLPQEAYKLANTDQARYVGVAMVANSLHREGIADLVDKKHFLLLPQDTIYRPLMENSLKDSDSMIIRLNAELERLAASPGEGARLRSLVSRGGHAPGHYMALVIERNGYLPELLKTIHRPFNFLFLYNKAAQKDGQKPPQFSPAAIAFLRRVENLFL
jgi:hypothetical protein